ncbi:Sulfite oxidase [Linum perenne]
MLLQQPFNAEPHRSALVNSYVTPVDFFYKRNHGPIPVVDDIERYSVSFKGLIETHKELTMRDIRSLPKYNVAATLQCAGNRRTAMSKVKTVKGVGWDISAIGNAVWGGAKLADVLELIGIPKFTAATKSGGKHVEFVSIDKCKEENGGPYKASIPLIQATNPEADVLLAYEMNGEGFFMQKDYKMFPPSVNWDNINWSTRRPQMDFPVQVTVRGYAVSGGGRGIERVDVSIDGGKTWVEASRYQKPGTPYVSDDEKSDKWAWVLFEAIVDVPRSTEIVAKAVDSAANVQPESVQEIWNLRGVVGMARRTAKQRRRVIVYVVAMCYHVMQQVVGLLTECSGSSRSVTEEGEYIPRPLPLLGTERSMTKGNIEGTRDYKVWTRVEEQTLIASMREMADAKLVEKGNFRLAHLKALEKMMAEKLGNCQIAVPHIKSKASGFGWDTARGCVVADDEVFAGWVKSHPKASGMNHKPMPYFDDLCVIFGVDQATGAHAVQPGDAVSRVVARPGVSSYMDEDEVEQGDSYNIPNTGDHNAVMEDLINQGIDMHATGLRHVEAEITSKRDPVKGKEAATSSGSKRTRQQFTDEDRARIAASMVTTTESIGKIADSYCIEGDLALKRRSLYQELAKFPELTSNQRSRALRHLNRDDGDASTFFQFPTDEEKLQFVWEILE